MANKNRQERIVNQLSKMSDKEVQRIRTYIEIECANREIPNKINLSMENQTDYQLTILFTTFYQYMQKRGILPQGVTNE